jgi:cellulose synthase operon protein C
MIYKIPLIFLIFSVISFSQNVNDFNNRYMLGESYAQSGNFQKAKEIFENLHSANPQNYQVFESLNRIYIQLKEYDYSVKIIEEKLKISGTDVNLYGMLGTTYHLMGDEKKAYQTWDEGIKLGENNPVFYRVIANYAIQRRSFDKAIEILQRGKSAAPDPQYFSYDLANIFTLTMRYEQAAEEYCIILENDENQLRAIESRILSYSNKPDALDATIKVVEKWQNKNEGLFSFLLARLYIEKKEFEKAFTLYRKIDEMQNNRGAELFAFAQLVMSEGEYETASKIFGEIINNYPNSPIISNVKLGYAKTLEAKLNAEISEEIPQWKPFYTVEINEPEKTSEVVAAYMELVKNYPHSEAAYEALYRAGNIKFSKLNNSSEAEKYFKMIVDESPLSRYAGEAFLALGKINLTRGDLSKAVENFNKIISNSRADESLKNNAFLHLANIEFFRGDFLKAKEILSRILNNLKDDSANDAIEMSLLMNSTMNDSLTLVIFAEGEFLAEQKKFKEAAEKYKTVKMKKGGFLLQNLAEVREAEMELALDNIETSIELLGNISLENGKNIYSDKALYLLGQIYQFGMKDIPKAIETYENLLAKYPNSLYLDEARGEIVRLKNKLS